MKRTGLLIAALGLFLFAGVAQADWRPAKRLTWTAGYSREPEVAVDGSWVHVVWQDDTTGQNEIYYKKSTDGGATWSPTQRLTWTSGNSEYPAIAIDSSGYLHAVWDDATTGSYALYHKMSTDGGNTWQANKRLTLNSGGSFCPSLAAGPSNRLHLAWQDYNSGNGEIYYMRSTDGGATWTTSQRLTWNSGSSGYPSIGVGSSNNIHIIWEDDTPGNYEVYYKKSTDGGATWATSQRLSSTSGWSSYPVLAVGPFGNLHVVWGDGTPGNYEIYYRKGSNGGDSWAASRRLTWTSGISDNTSIAADSSGNVHVVWNDNTPGNNEISYKNSTDQGATWAATQRLTWNAGSSESPRIVIDPSANLHVVWSDSTPGKHDIYYKKFSK